MAFVISFDVNIDLLQDFTNSVHLLKTALNSAKINTGGGGGVIPGLGGGPVPSSTTPRGTLLYDAVYLASHDELGQQVGRKAMVLLTDGDDEGSQSRSKMRWKRPRNPIASFMYCYVPIADSMELAAIPGQVR